MTTLTKHGQAAVLRWLTDGTYLAIMTGDSEVEADGYERMPMGRWVIDEGDFAEPSSTRNDSAFQWPAAMTDWSSRAGVTGYAIFPENEGGRPIAVGKFTDEPQPVCKGNTLSVPVGAIVISVN